MGRIVFRNKGITLIELLVVLVISSILLGALYQTFIRQQKSYAVQEQVVEAQQNIRIAMDTIVRYVRMAGYDPLRTGQFGFQAGTGPNSIMFRIDFNENGAFTADEQIGFRLDSINLQRWVTNQWQPMVDNIESLSFLYTLSNGTTTSSPANLADIRMVRVAIRARTSILDPELGSGGGYRRRELTSLIKVRNLGI